VDCLAIENLLKRWAEDEGFDLAGIARVERPKTGRAFLTWLEMGDQAGMAYMARRVQERLDPALLLPGVASALCVAWRYAPLESAVSEEAPPGSLWTRVARYARGFDYHDFLKDRLDRLAARIRLEFPGCRTRVGLDTSPILERDLARRAGVGWVGKNTMLIHPRQGSYFLLGEILLTLSLEPDPPIEDLCGSCTACLEACPTGALPEPYRLDSRRCISYLTIEHRGALPEGAEGSLAGWVFGCDLCQEACPWNRKAPPVERPEAEVLTSRRGLRLVDLLSMDRAAYTETFRGSPLKRAKFEGLRRNAAALAGRAASA
jgi:epoxyqueuosine reductase